jgi:hypothetical protein
MGVGSFIWHFTEYLCFLAIISYVGLNFIERFKINRKMYLIALDSLIKRNRENVEKDTRESYSEESKTVDDNQDSKTE